MGVGYSRRDLLKCLAAGGAVIAGELWVPGARKIFIPETPNPAMIDPWIDVQFKDGRLYLLRRHFIVYEPKPINLPFTCGPDDAVQTYNQATSASRPV